MFVGIKHYGLLDMEIYSLKNNYTFHEHKAKEKKKKKKNFGYKKVTYIFTSDFYLV